MAYSLLSGFYEWLTHREPVRLLLIGLDDVGWAEEGKGRPCYGLLVRDAALATFYAPSFRMFQNVSPKSLLALSGGEDQRAGGPKGCM